MTLPDDQSHIAHNLAAVRERMAGAAARAGRDVAEVTLVAVSKTQPAEAVQAAWEAGQRVFGENRVQEALEKMAHCPPEAQWHLVGHLQTNKARKVAGTFAMLHSLDSIELAREMNRRQGSKVEAGEAAPLEVLIQLNWTSEATKSGVQDMASLGEMIAVLRDCPHLRPRGLMTMPDPDYDERQTRAHFSLVRDLLSAARAEHNLGAAFDQLSMGMTHDFEWAIEEGATIIRVGTAIFGARQPMNKQPQPQGTTP